jgi:hypothetical protein
MGQTCALAQTASLSMLMIESLPPSVLGLVETFQQASFKQTIPCL